MFELFAFTKGRIHRRSLKLILYMNLSWNYGYCVVRCVELRLLCSSEQYRPRARRLRFVFIMSTLRCCWRSFLLPFSTFSLQRKKKQSQKLARTDLWASFMLRSVLGLFSLPPRCLAGHALHGVGLYLWTMCRCLLYLSSSLLISPSRSFVFLVLFLMRSMFLAFFSSFLSSSLCPFFG